MNRLGRISSFMAVLVWVMPAMVPAQAGRAVAPSVTAAEPGAFLGVHLKEETEHAEGGARVIDVVSDSPAQKAGIDVGDIVVGFDGEVIRGPLALTEHIHAAKPGDKVELAVLRDGKRRQVDVELGERSWNVYVPFFGDAEHVMPLDEVPRFEEGNWAVLPEGFVERMGKVGERLGEIYGDPDYSENHAHAIAPLFDVRAHRKPRLGVQLVETTLELREHLGGSEQAGVLVSKVLSGTPAEASGVQVGDLILSVDGESVASASELVAALEDVVGRTISLVIVRENRKKTIEVTIPEPEKDERPSGPRAAAPRVPRRVVGLQGVAR